MTIYEHPAAEAASNPHLFPLELLGARGGLIDALQGIEDHPPGEYMEDRGEPFRSMARVLIKRLADPYAKSPLITLVDGLNQDRQKMTFELRAHQLRLGLHYCMMELLEPDEKYPDTDQEWDEKLDYVMETEEWNWKFTEVVSGYHNQANIPDRGRGAVIGAAVAGLLGKELSLAELGPSAGLILTQLAEGIPFSPATIDMSGYIADCVNQLLDEQRAGKNWSHKEIGEKVQVIYDKANAMAELINRTIIGGIDVGVAVGGDILPMPDIFWVYSCATQPSERKDRDRQAIWEFLHKRKSPNTKFVWADMASDNPEALSDMRKPLPEGKADIVLAISSIYEVVAAKRSQAIANARGLARTALLVQESAEIVDGELVVNDDIYAPDSYYRLFYLDLTQDKPQWQTLCTYGRDGKDFRCSVIVPHQALIEWAERQLDEAT